MREVRVSAVREASGGHLDEEAAGAFDDFQSVNSEAVVEDDVDPGSEAAVGG